MKGRWLTPAVAAPTAMYCRRLIIPLDASWIAPVMGALEELLKIGNWQQLTGISREDTVAAYEQMFEEAQRDECLIGTCFPYISDTLPTNAVACSGQTLLRVDFPKLYAILDPVFIIDADHFRTPDLRGRTVIGRVAAPPPGISVRTMGAFVGEENHQLTITEMPAHNHGEIIAVATLINGGLEAPAQSAIPAGGFTSTVGNNGAHNNMQPSQALRWAMWAK